MFLIIMGNAGFIFHQPYGFHKGLPEGLPRLKQFSWAL